MVNKVILVGNVGIDPEVRTTESGVKVARIRLATTERLFDRQANEAKEHTEWHTITLWRGLADVVDRYVRKGTQIYVEGRLRTREWMDKDNNKRYTTEIMADVMNLLGRRSDNPASDSASSGYGSQQQAPAYGGQPAAGRFPAACGAATRGAGRSGGRSRRLAVLRVSERMGCLTSPENRKSPLPEFILTGVKSLKLDLLDNLFRVIRLCVELCFFPPVSRGCVGRFPIWSGNLSRTCRHDPGAMWQAGAAMASGAIGFSRCGGLWRK